MEILSEILKLFRVYNKKHSQKDIYESRSFQYQYFNIIEYIKQVCNNNNVLEISYCVH